MGRPGWLEVLVLGGVACSCGAPMEDTVNAPNITPQVAVSEAALPLVSTLARNGLGLSIARQIVESHGGSLNIESTPGDGSTFVTRVPLNADPPPET